MARYGWNSTFNKFQTKINIKDFRKTSLPRVQVENLFFKKNWKKLTLVIEEVFDDVHHGGHLTEHQHSVIRRLKFGQNPIEQLQFSWKHNFFHKKKLSYFVFRIIILKKSLFLPETRINSCPVISGSFQCNLHESSMVLNRNGWLHNFLRWTTVFMRALKLAACVETTVIPYYSFIRDTIIILISKR